MMKILTYLKFVFWVKVLRNVQFYRIREFMPGDYICMDSLEKKIKIKRLSEAGEVYQLTVQDGSEEKQWACCFHQHFLVLWSHDFDKSVGFIPEERKLTYEGLQYIKTN